jgi:ATP-dependent RNA helicase DeaD
MTTEISAELSFGTLGLVPAVMRALDDAGYARPTPIQARTIPSLLQGRDVLGQAQTGTGKTAAFALPLLSRIDVKMLQPQVLVLTPTRELAMQVAAAFQKYAAHMPELNVLPVYGGQDYARQLKMLARGVHVVVGTPGRIMDHMRRGSLKLSGLRTVVLDEADEMLRMGFIDDVELILGQTPPGRQLALFSATLPREVQRIARTYQSDPVEVRLESRSSAATAVRQRVWMVAGTHKLDALTRILEAETFDAAIVFVRTKVATVELAERLGGRGFDAAAINGDLAQQQRERLIANLRAGKLNILVATDVAARGLDVERVTLVVNYDMPPDAEAYVHRIGRTGRAGRSGDAVLFAAPRERHMLRSIERATGQPIEVMSLPSNQALQEVRVQRFFDALSTTLKDQDLTELMALMERYQTEHDVDPLRMAAALAHQIGGGVRHIARAQSAAPTPDESPRPIPRVPREKRKSSRRQGSVQAADLEVFRLEVGRDHGAGPGNIVGALINEAGITRNYVGRVEMAAEHSTVELPVGMPREIFAHLRNVWVAGRRLNISRVAAHG